MKYRWLPRPEVPQSGGVPLVLPGIPEQVVSVMNRRGFTPAFIRSSYDNLSPWRDLPGAEQASSVLEQAVKNGDLILIHGDYDADGITASATAVRVIRALGGRVQHYIPSRFREGYGLGKAAVTMCIETGASVLVTVDCGITSVEEVDRLRKSGITVIVTDHHKPSPVLPDANVLVDPELSDLSIAPWRYLSGAGVIHFVLRGLAERMGAEGIPELEPDLVSIGTVCDMVRLAGDNRILVKRGIEVLRTNPSAGVKALIKAAGMEYTQLTARDIGFGLGPVINSSGRITHADQAVDLLLEKDRRAVEEMAASLVKVNEQRKILDSTVASQATERLEKTSAQIAVAGSDQWHPGVIGISASRLARQINKPVVLISWDGDTGRGSARGVEGKPVYPVLSEAMKAGLLLTFGGHNQAAGISISRDSFSEFKSFVESYANSVFSGESAPLLYIDGGLSPEQCSIEVLRALEQLGPFGEGNPEPVWITRGVYPASFRSVGQGGRHLQCSFQSGSATIRGIGFGMGHRTSELDRLLDIAFTLSADTWRGNDSVQLVLKDIKPAAGRKN